MTTTWSATTKESHIILSNGNLTALCGAGQSYSPGACDTFITSGQTIYFEVRFDVLAQAGATAAGIANASNTYSSGQYLGITNNAIGYFDDGTVIRNNATIATYSVPAQGDTIGVAVKSGDKLWLSLNGVWQSGDPNTLTDGIDISSLGDVAPAYSVVGTSTQTQNTANFGATVLAHTAPTGFLTFDAAPLPISVDVGGSKRRRRRELEDQAERAYERMLLREGLREYPEPEVDKPKPRLRRRRKGDDEELMALLLLS
jgi:hypothetical protein